MEDTLKMSLLYDTYGTLLTDKQQTCFELYYHQDLSLAEIAEEEGISRQGVHDSLAHAKASLLRFEDALGNVSRDLRLQQAILTITASAESLRAQADPAVREQAEAILSALSSIKE